MESMKRYSRVASALHWLIALAIFATFPLGLYMADLPLSPQKLRYFSWHKWAGVSIFFLVLIRVLWRVSHEPPAPLAMPYWQRFAAQTAHYLLYTCMLLIPLSGWFMSSAQGFQTVWFGVVPLPDLIEKNAAMAQRLTQAHELLNYGMLGLVIVHAAAALEHQFIRKDGLIGRMNPLFRSEKSS
jgi:cytochrome b561